MELIFKHLQVDIYTRSGYVVMKQVYFNMLFKGFPVNVFFYIQNKHLESKVHSWIKSQLE